MVSVDFKQAGDADGFGFYDLFYLCAACCDLFEAIGFFIAEMFAGIQVVIHCALHQLPQCCGTAIKLLSLFLVWCCRKHSTCDEKQKSRGVNQFVHWPFSSTTGWINSLDSRTFGLKILAFCCVAGNFHAKSRLQRCKKHV